MSLEALRYGLFQEISDNACFMTIRQWSSRSLKRLDKNERFEARSRSARRTGHACCKTNERVLPARALASKKGKRGA